MIPTVEWMANKFKYFNSEFFEGKLQAPKFVVGCDYGQWGYLEYRANYNKLTRNITKVLSQPVLKLTNAYDRDEKDVESTLLHEMIHLYVYEVEKTYPVMQHKCSGFIKMANKIKSKGYTIEEKTNKKPTDIPVNSINKQGNSQQGTNIGPNGKQGSNIDPNKQKTNPNTVNSIIKLNGTLDTMLNNNYFKRKDTINTVNVLKNQLKMEVPQLTESYLRKVVNETINKNVNNNCKLKLTESELHNIIKESVKRILSEKNII